MRIVAISDTHGRHWDLDMPPGDVLVHCGDFSMLGQLGEVVSFLDWFEDQHYRHKVLIAGNHDWLFQRDSSLARSLIEQINTLVWSSTRVHYLENSGVELDGVKFYGAPWTPRFGDWAFMLNDRELEDEWAKVPNDVDVLVTHGPPRGILDLSPYGNIEAGDTNLMERILQMPNLKAHIFGHIHDGYGRKEMASMRGQEPIVQVTTFYNVATCNEFYEPVNPPMVIEV